MEKIITRTEIISIDNSGIVICRAIKDSFLEIEDAIANLDAVKKFGNSKRVPVLVDIRESKGASKECRAYFASDEAAKIQSAGALLISSPLSRLIGNFFIGLNKPKFPTILFTNEDEAIKWLKTFL